MITIKKIGYVQAFGDSNIYFVTDKNQIAKLMFYGKQNARNSGIPENEIHRYGLIIATPSEYPFMSDLHGNCPIGLNFSKSGELRGGLICSQNDIDYGIKFVD